MLIHDARMLIEHVLRKDKGAIAELLTTNEYFIAHPRQRVCQRALRKRIAEILDPGHGSASATQKQIKGDFNFENMPEKAEKALVSAQRDAEKTVAMYQWLDKGMHRHPAFPFEGKRRGIADLLYIEPYNCLATDAMGYKSGIGPSSALKMPKDQRAGLLTHPAGWQPIPSMRTMIRFIADLGLRTVARRGARRRPSGCRCSRANRSPQDPSGTNGTTAKRTVLEMPP